MSKTNRPAAVILAALGTGLIDVYHLSWRTGLPVKTVRASVARMVKRGILLSCPYGVVAASAVAS